MLVMILFAFLTSSALAGIDEGVLIHNGFGTGLDYMQMPDTRKQAYAMGVIDGMLLAPLFGAPKSNMRWFESCVENMTDIQVAAILTKYLEKNPGRWHQTTHALMFSATKEVCPK
jgi:hypothetical protein